MQNCKLERRELHSLHVRFWNGPIFVEPIGECVKPTKPLPIGIRAGTCGSWPSASGSVGED